MSSILETLNDASCEAFKALGFPAKLGQTRESDRPDLAPFQCNGAMAAAGFLRKQGEKANPREIAEKVVEKLKGNPAIETMEIAGPGFINIHPTQPILTARGNALANDDRVGARQFESKSIIIDYGGANVAKTCLLYTSPSPRDRG